jgi:hypothetical protein
MVELAPPNRNERAPIMTASGSQGESHDLIDMRRRQDDVGAGVELVRLCQMVEFQPCAAVEQLGEFIRAGLMRPMWSEW